MLKRIETQYAGHDCIQLRNEQVSIWVTRSVGPRIIAISSRDGENLFAELPKATLDCPGEGQFYFYGGHRLWYAPENPKVTYMPDDKPVEVREISDGIQVVQTVGEKTGIRKSMKIWLKGGKASLSVDHTLENLGELPVELAPWAITQFRVGGMAILPQGGLRVDEPGVLPDRHLVLWPYTEINSPHIMWGDQFIFVEAEMSEGALKLGFPNPVGWLAYAYGNTLFVKWADYDHNAGYYDRGSSSECYCDSRFLELETMGPKTTVSPGEHVTHQETWRIYSQVEFTPTEEGFRTLAESLKLCEPYQP